MGVQSMATTYDHTREAWRDIWLDNSDFEQEYGTLSYKRAQDLFKLYLPFLTRHDLILEAGCGLGHVVYYLRQRGYNVAGVDYVPEALQPEIAHKLGLPLMAADVHQLPYATDSLNGYLSFGVVEHFENGPMAALREAFRVLKPGGVLILTVPHPNFVESLRNFANRVIPGRLERVGKRAEYYESQPDHRSMARFIEQAGFKVERSEPIAHSYTWYGLGPLFRAPGYYKSSALGEVCGTVSRWLLPWATAFGSLTIARKP